jgi:signal transduction histidine kinase
MSRHYTLHLILAITLLILSAAGTVVCICCPHGILTTLLAIVGVLVLLVSVLRIVRIIRFPIRSATTFTQALINRDVTLRCIPTHDPLIGEMMNDMNSVLTSYCHDRSEMEKSRKYNDDILRVMTHELRNTLTPIVSLTRWLQTEQHTDEETAEAIGVIHHQAEEIRSFIDSYQKLTHLPKPEMETVSVGELFRSIATLMASEVNAGRITFNPCKETTLMADAGLLTLALNNLIHNALHVTEGQEDGHASVSAFDDTDRVRIVVSNNGPELMPTDLERIFQPFYTTDRKNGSGIGLPLSRRIAEAHGGSLTCESLPGLTFFELSLPKP